MRHRRTFVEPLRIARVVCVLLGVAGVAGCGGSGGGGGPITGSAVSLDTGSAASASVAAALLIVAAQSTVAEPLVGGGVLMSNAVSPRGGATEAASTFPGLLRWDPVTRRVTHAVRLEMPLELLRASLGDAASIAYRSEIADVRALPDGGAFVQFDLLVDAAVSPARRAASVLARLRGDLSVAWTRTWAGGQAGRIEVRGDAVATTGDALMRYDGQGRSVSQEALGGGGFVLTDPSGGAVLGVPGGLLLRGAVGGDRFIAMNADGGWHAAVADAAGGAVVVGWGRDSTAGGSFHPVAVRLDASGRPVQSVQLGDRKSVV